ncbi:MAG: hypothetical protein GC192_12970 [Bacteroidetes bacterium]|nr:hypothetical protein [Bacteroidota bacterium]
MKNLLSFLHITGLLAFIMVPFFLQAQNDVQNYRPYDQRGANIFETPKSDMGASGDFKVRVGANFAQQFQALDHSNKADYLATSATDSTNANQLIDLSPGFNLASANLNLDAQLGEGVRVNVITYLSARHHTEAYVKGGYIQFDKLPFFNSEGVDNLMNNLTIKVGHYEVNYGDAHYRRSDNGAALYNPFIENLILDAFNTEIGGELIYQKNGLVAVGAVTNGEIKGDVVKLPDLKPEDVDNSSKKSPAFIGKLGYDKQVSDDLRVRVTGSAYYTASSKSNNLYGGDRAGSRYYLVMENTKATTDGNFYSGRLRPSYSDEVLSFMGNAFLKYKGLEFFGTFENASGRKSNESDMRTATQWATDLIYRFGKEENFYLAGRYNNVKAELPAAGSLYGKDNPVTISRYEISAGWYLNKNILAKLAYVNEDYKDYPSKSIYYEGNFNGVVFEAVVGF